MLKDGAVVQEGKPEEIVLKPANPHVEEFVRDVNKARAIHVRAIMTPEEGVVCDYSVPADARCEDVLPLFAKHEWVGVTGPDGKTIGRISAKQVIAALARYSA